jgi:hemerythrin
MARQDLFNLGVERMDIEHRALADLFDEFTCCIKENPQNADGIVQRAIALANAHFEHEEELATRTSYPDAEDHRLRHRNLRLKLTTLVGDTIGYDNHNPVTLENLDIMRSLLEEHITGPDRALAEHVKASGLK